MNKRLQIACVVLLGCLQTASTAAAELSCPALETAVQLAPCPSEAELRYTYNGFCSDNARLYGRDILLCANFDEYRAAKNIARWESADGQFSGYLSCNVSAQSIRRAAALRMHQETRNGLTRVMCDYEHQHRLEYRTRAQCTVEVESCTGSSCRTVCQ